MVKEFEGGKGKIEGCEGDFEGVEGKIDFSLTTLKFLYHPRFCLHHPRKTHTDHEPNDLPLYNTGMVLWLKIPVIFREFDV